MLPWQPFWGFYIMVDIGATWQTRLNRPCAVAMWPMSNYFDHLLYSVSQKLYVLKLKHKRLKCGPMPNVMAALPNIGGALCSTPQRLADTHY